MTTDPAFVSASSNHTVPGSSITATNVVNAPASIVAGNLLVAIFTNSHNDGTETITPPSGWTAAGSTFHSTVGNGAIFWKIATGSEPATYTFTSTYSAAANHYMNTAIHQYQGADSTTPFSATPVWQAYTTGTTAPAAPSVTPSTANGTSVMGWAPFDGKSLTTAPSGATLRTSYTDGANYGLYTADKNFTAATNTATGAQTPTTVSDTWIAVQGMINPTAVVSAFSGSAAFSATSALATGSSAGPVQSSALNATVALASTGVMAQGATGAAVLNPISSLVASGTPKTTNTAALSSTVALAQSDSIATSGTAAVGASVSLSATPSLTTSGSASLSAQVSLGSTGSMVRTVGTSASASLTVQPTPAVGPQSAPLSSTVSLSSGPSVAPRTSASFSISAGLNVPSRSASLAAPTTFTATTGLSATAVIYVPVIVPSSLRVFDMRLRAATPLGPQGAVIPDLGFTVASTDNGGATLSAKVSSAVYGTIPQNLEVIVEWWHVATQQWQEGRDSRFIITQFDTDDRDRTGVVTLTGVDIGTFFYSAAVLKGVDPYVNTTGTSEAARTNAAVTVSGTTFTWTGHILSTGDRVRITSVGKATRLKSNSIYYVINPTTNTFQLAVSANGTALNCGTATNVGMTRVVTRIVFSGSHPFTKSDSISVLGGTALGLNDGNQYYVVNPTGSTIQITDTPGGVPIELKAASTNVSQVYRYLDGQRVFTNAHPGTIMSTAFLEARSRGWGVGSDGTTMLTHSWSTTADSTGAAWTTMADDPTTPGISIGFQPGTPTSQILQTMLDNQYAEWYVAAGRILGLVNYGTGTDHTVGATPIRIGTTASAVKVQTDLTQLRNAVTVRGTGPILTEVTGATTGTFGRLEMYETASGATSKSLANKQGQTDLGAHGSPTVAYTVTEMAEQSAWLPLKDYSRGDWVACQLQNTGWSSLRCVGWQFQKQPGSPITVTTNLAAIKKTLQSKIVRKITNVTSGISASSTGQSLLETDNRKASAPAGVTVTTSGFFALDDSSQSTATVAWLPVVTDIVGGDIQTTMYDVWLRPEGTQFGQSVGHTTALSLDITPLPSGHTYAVSVRAQTSDGQWGEFSAEVEFTTNYSFAIPNIPTTPTVTGSLGSVRVAWDGNLIDANGNVVAASDATNNGFAYVYTQYALSSAVLLSSGGTTVGQNMGHAGYTVVGGLTVGVTYYFALFAVNTVGVVSAISAVQSFTIVGISGPDLTAGSVTANQMAAGSITTDKLDVGTIPQGTPQDRVAMPLTQSAFWNLANGGSSAVYAAATGATASSSGVALAANGLMWITQKLTDVPSSYIYLHGLATTGTATFYVREWSTATASTDTAVALSVSGQQYALKSTTINYAVYIKNTSTTASVTITAAHVTEAVGAGYDYEGVTIQPDGLRIYSGQNANPTLALTSSSADIISLSDATGDQVAVIDTSGNGAFTEVTADVDVDVAGSTLIGPAAANLANAIPNGGVAPWQIAGPGDTTGIGLLDIPGRSVPYAATWVTQNGKAVTSQYYAIASDVFQVEDGRVVMLLVNNGALQVNNPSGDANVYLDLQLCLTPMPAANGGTGAVRISRSVVYGGNAGNYVEQATIWRTSASQATIDTTNFVLPANVPIYWQYNTDAGSAPSGFSFAEFGNVRQFMVMDLGSSQVLGASGFATATDGRTAGAQTITGGGTSTVTSTTKTFTATWSASYHDSGGTKVTGSTQYDNAKALYQGNGVTPMGAQWGFSLGSLAGKTITSASLYLKNQYMGYSNGTVQLGSHSNSSATSTIGNGYGANHFTSGWSSGSGKWISLSSAIRSGLSSGSVKGFQIGIDGSNTDYMYFQGVGYGSNPPQLKVTYY